MNDLNKKSIEELKKLEEESRAELFALKFQSAMGNLEKPHRIGELRRQIARILTILSSRKIAGENTQVNVKIDLNETYAKIEKESQVFAKEKRAKIEKMMAEQETAANPMAGLMDMPLPIETELDSSVTEAKESSPAKPAVKKAASSKKTVEKADTVAKKPGSASKTKPAAAKTSTAKVAVEKPAAAKTSTAKPAVEKPAAAKTSTAKTAQEKLTSVKKSVPKGAAVGKGTGVNNDIKTKAKDPNAEEYVYGANWTEHKEKVTTTKPKPATTKVKATEAKKTPAKKGNSK